MLNTTAELEFAAAAGESRAGAEELRAQVAARLAAHRSRQTARPAEGDVRPAPRRNGRSARIAAAVAERYAQTPSYRAVLAAEAARAVEQARAAAEVAARNAEAVAAAQMRLLEALDESEGTAAEPAWSEGHEAPAARFEQQSVREDTPQLAEDAVEMELWPELAEKASAHAGEVATKAGRRHAAHVAGPTREAEAGRREAGLTVRLYEDEASAAHVDLERARHAAALARTNRWAETTDADARALDEEIAFRQAPVFEEPAGPPVPLPANLIEFPRHLVAPRKARPRYAEGPLREEEPAAEMDGQLRIFEVDPAQISTEPAQEDAAATAQWTSLWLDTATAEGQIAGAAEALAAEGPEMAGRELPVMQIAPMSRRALAAAVNGAAILTAVATFWAGFAWMVDRAAFSGLNGVHGLRAALAGLPAQTGLKPVELGVIAAVAAAFLWAAYNVLFFCLNEVTPGMRLARIGLCTFEDENPTRRQVRRRAWAALLSAGPLGMGFAWAALDDDRLTWHDRLTRMYPRAY